MKRKRVHKRFSRRIPGRGKYATTFCGEKIERDKYNRHCSHCWACKQIQAQNEIGALFGILRVVQDVFLPDHYVVRPEDLTRPKEPRPPTVSMKRADDGTFKRSSQE